MDKPAKKLFRCAIYTRKSTEHILDLEFNSLDAQREACEAYTKSQAHEGWRLVPGAATAACLLWDAEARRYLSFGPTSGPIVYCDEYGLTQCNTGAPHRLTSID